MRSVDEEQSGRQGRYARGVQKLNPDLVEKITKILDEDPAISKSELARRVGCSRATLGYYLRGMGQQVEEAGARRAEIAERRALTYFGLLEKVSETAGQIEDVISGLRKWPAPVVAGHLVRAFSTLQREQRLLAELMGKR